VSPEKVVESGLEGELDNETGSNASLSKRVTASEQMLRKHSEHDE
jgi:hypothetical protein